MGMVGDLCCEEDDLDLIVDIDAVFDASNTILKRLSQLALICRAGARPVTGGCVVGTDGSGNWLTKSRIRAQFSVRIVSSRELTPNVLPALLTAADQYSEVRHALADWSSEADFAALRRISDIVILDLEHGDTRAGLQEIQSR